MLGVIMSVCTSGTDAASGLADRLVIMYDRLVTASGRVLDASLTITVTACVSTCPGFLFEASIENHGSVRINELMLPLIDLACGCGEDRLADVLLEPDGLGARLTDPWNQIRKKYHSEYICSDEHVVWDSYRYPGGAAMAWFGLETGGYFLYLGRHADDLKIKVLSAGASPRPVADGASPQDRLVLTISHFPFARSGEKVSVDACFVALADGDWRVGSDIYGNYASSHWYQPAPVPDWVRHVTGWQRIILRHQFGEKLFSYADLPAIYREGTKVGLNMLMVFGWWKGRFDNGYPIYEPDDDLGGTDALKEAIAEVQKLGGYVALYTNGQLIDVNTDYYRQTGKDICRIDLDGNEYRDHYRFGNDGQTLRAFGYKSFVTACPANEAWQDLLLEHEEMKYAYGADSAFFDQIGGASPLLCFNESHLHGPRPDECEKWRRRAFQNLAGAAPSGKALGTEMVTDMCLPFVQYIHGCQTGPIYRPGCFPEMFQRTFPDIIQTDRFVHDTKDGTDASFGNAFIHGYRLDVCPWRGRTHIGSIPALAEKVKRYLALKQQYHAFFYEGHLSFDDLPPLPKGVRAGRFTLSGNEKSILAVWNSSDASVEWTFESAGGAVLCRLAPQEYTVIPDTTVYSVSSIKNT